MNTQASAAAAGGGGAGTGRGDGHLPEENVSNVVTMLRAKVEGLKQRTVALQSIIDAASGGMPPEGNEVDDDDDDSSEEAGASAGEVVAGESNTICMATAEARLLLKTASPDGKPPPVS